MPIDAIRDVVLYTLQSQLKTFHGWTQRTTRVFEWLCSQWSGNEVKAVSQQIDSLQWFLEQSNARLKCFEASNDRQSYNADKFTRDHICELQVIIDAMTKPSSQHSCTYANSSNSSNSPQCCIAMIRGWPTALGEAQAMKYVKYQTFLFAAMNVRRHMLRESSIAL